MKTILVLLMIFVLTGCKTTYKKEWTVHPDDMAKYEKDQVECDQKARAMSSLTGRYTPHYDYCMQTIGYRMDITSEDKWFFQP